MIIGAVALTIDRCILSVPELAPDSAAAAVAEPNEAQASREPEGPPVLSVLKAAFPHNLNSYRVGAVTRDIFAPPNWGNGRQNKDAPTDKLQGSDESGTAIQVTGEVFVARHRLEGVMLSEGLRIAIVGGAWVQVGESIDGCRLERITGHEAHFHCDGESAVLKLAD